MCSAEVNGRQVRWIRHSVFTLSQDFLAVEDHDLTAAPQPASRVGRARYRTVIAVAILGAEPTWLPESANAARRWTALQSGLRDCTGS